MKHFLPFVVALVLASLVGCSRSGGPVDTSNLKWMTDAEAAMAMAKSENKVLLMDFTGSDWCVWCQRLDAEVFAKAEFQRYAEKNLVLLKLDFPRSGTQPEAEKAQNRALLEKHGVKGFPTILFFSATGEKLGELGYQPGGPEAWIASLEKVVKG